eukprot:2158570-Rhodomonas_salina.2
MAVVPGTIVHGSHRLPTSTPGTTRTSATSRGSYTRVALPNPRLCLFLGRGSIPRANATLRCRTQRFAKIRKAVPNSQESQR